MIVHPQVEDFLLQMIQEKTIIYFDLYFVGDVNMENLILKASNIEIKEKFIFHINSKFSPVLDLRVGGV